MALEQSGEPIVAKVHPQISNLREFIETFAYQFSHGANAERVSNSKDLFYYFYDSLRDSNILNREEMGGHSTIWAIRAQREQCKVFIAAQTSKLAEDELIVNEKYLNWPREEIDKYPDEKKNKIDLHLVFEYAEGDSILGGRFVAPRSNRFYFVHDPNGGVFKQLEVYHDLVSGTNRHMFGGYQLLQKLDMQAAE